MTEPDTTTGNDNDEIWKPIPGYKELYSVSSVGRVRRDARGKSTRPGRVLTPRPRHGYLTVSLYGKSVEPKQIGVHSLVMAAFVGPCPEGMEVDHRNTTRYRTRNRKRSDLEASHASNNWRLNRYFIDAAQLGIPQCAFWDSFLMRR